MITENPSFLYTFHYSLNLMFFPCLQDDPDLFFPNGHVVNSKVIGQIQIALLSQFDVIYRRVRHMNSVCVTCVRTLW